MKKHPHIQNALLRYLLELRKFLRNRLGEGRKGEKRESEGEGRERELGKGAKEKGDPGGGEREGERRFHNFSMI